MTERVVDNTYRCGCKTGVVLPDGGAFVERCEPHQLAWPEPTMEEAVAKSEGTLVRFLCEAMDVPYESPEGHGTRRYTFAEVVDLVRSRSNAWREYLQRIEEVDPEWIDARRGGRRYRPEPPKPTDTSLIATIRDPEGQEIPVARVAFVDVLGDTRVMDFDVDTALQLTVQLLGFVKQVGLSRE